MKKLKLIFKILSVVVAILLLALAAFIFTFDPNNYKDTITARVEQQTGRNFEIAGDISWSFFPWVGVKVDGVMLANAEGFSEEPFARMSQLDVKVMLLPLFRKELQIDKVRLHGLFVSLEVDKDGNNNWSELTRSETSEAQPREQQPAQATETGEHAPAIAVLAINGVELVDATVIWSDAQNNVYSRLSDFDLATGAVRFNEAVDFQLNTRVKHNEPELEALINLTTRLTFNEAFTNILLDALKLEVSANAPLLSKEKLELALQSDINIDIDQQFATLNNTQISTLNATLHASLDVSGLLSKPEISGTLHTDDINLRELMSHLQIELPPMAQDNSLTKIAFASRVKANANAVELDDIKLNLDDAELTGWLHVPDVAESMLRYKLHLSPINADAYMAPASTTAPKAAAPAAQAGVTAAPGSTAASTVTAEQEPEIELPVELLRKLDMRGELAMDSVTINKIPVTDILVKAQAKAGVVRIDPLQLEALEGSATASVMLNVKGKTPDYAIGVKASDIRPGPVIDPMLAGIFGQKDISMDGAANVLADIKTKGTRVSQLKKAARGNLRFDMARTVLQGVDFEYYVRNVVADYLTTKSLVVPAEWRGSFDPETKTAFNRVHASAVVAHGDITNKDLILDSSRIKVKGEGVVNIVRDDMDYKALVDVEPTRRQTTAEKLLDQPLSIRIHGPFDQLAYDVDKNQLKKTLSSMLEAETRAKINKEIEEEKEKLRQKAKQEEEQYKEKLKDKLKDKLKGLF